MPLFTRENAAILGKRGAIARWTPKPPAPTPAPLPEPLPVDQFQSLRLARIRAQLDLIDDAITKEATKANADGQRLNWLASAQERVAEQERLASGRPLPGSMRPTGPGKRGAAAGWAMDQVAPTLPSAPPPPVLPMGWEYDTPTGSMPPPALPLP